MVGFPSKKSKERDKNVEFLTFFINSDSFTISSIHLIP